ncbi:uncharacterized protein LOC126747301 [Anthonomus grandis grandis]|uniref:uncharacterized protein LOC126747301 n=1 Tax=Anthonomus grandis grandis TaxID=2921223 RepID=UPI002164F49A|nr:uncharacterized protein LOC126747301 [Anthonomus grandis grandis]
MYKSVVVEFRPKLQSVNVFVCLNDECEETVVELLESSFKVSLKCSSRSLTVEFGPFKAQTSTLSSLKTSKNFISFRFFTQKTSTAMGSFKTELITNQSRPKGVVDVATVEPNTNYMIKCQNCQKGLLETPIKFDRVLPLPDNLDSGDWFCHAHDLPPKNDRLEPKPKDLFYAHCFVKINCDILRNYFEKNQIMVCKSCFNWLGVKEGGTAKLWFNTVSFNQITTRGLADLNSMVKKLFANSLFNSLKILLLYRDANGMKNYLLLWVLEKCLKINMKTPKEPDRECEVAKTLFRYFEGDNHDLVRQWKAEHNVEFMEVSRNMFLEVMKDLYLYNKVYPIEFSRANDFLVSYLFLYQ